MSRFLSSRASRPRIRASAGRDRRPPPDPYLVEELLLVVVDEYVDDLDPPFPFVSSLDDDEYLVRLVVVSPVNGSVVVDAASKADSSRKSTNSSPSVPSSSHSVLGLPGSGRDFSNASNSFSTSRQKSEKP